KAAAKGGNVLLNIGPMGTGQIAPEDQAILKGIGAWMAVNGESIWGTGRTPLERQAWGESTLKKSTLYLHEHEFHTAAGKVTSARIVRDDILYLHVFDWPSNGRLIVGGLRADIAAAY